MTYASQWSSGARDIFLFLSHAGMEYKGWNGICLFDSLVLFVMMMSILKPHLQLLFLWKLADIDSILLYISLILMTLSKCSGLVFFISNFFNWISCKWLAGLNDMHQCYTPCLLFGPVNRCDCTAFSAVLLFYAWILMSCALTSVCAHFWI